MFAAAASLGELTDLLAEIFLEREWGMKEQRKEGGVEKGGPFSSVLQWQIPGYPGLYNRGQNVSSSLYDLRKYIYFTNIIVNRPIWNSLLNSVVTVNTTNMLNKRQANPLPRPATCRKLI